MGLGPRQRSSTRPPAGPRKLLPCIAALVGVGISDPPHAAIILKNTAVSPNVAWQPVKRSILLCCHPSQTDSLHGNSHICQLMDGKPYHANKVSLAGLC